MPTAVQSRGRRLSNSELLAILDRSLNRRPHRPWSEKDRAEFWDEQDSQRSFALREVGWSGPFLDEELRRIRGLK